MRTPNNIKMCILILFIFVIRIDPTCTTSAFVCSASGVKRQTPGRVIFWRQNPIPIFIFFEFLHNFVKIFSFELFIEILLLVLLSNGLHLCLVWVILLFSLLLLLSLLWFLIMFNILLQGVLSFSLSFLPCFLLLIGTL